MKDQILILRDNYNLIEWEKAIIRRCMEDNPSFNVEELAEILGMAPRTIYRKIKEYGIVMTVEEKKLILKSFKKQTI